MADTARCWQSEVQTLWVCGSKGLWEMHGAFLGTQARLAVAAMDSVS